MKVITEASKKSLARGVTSLCLMLAVVFVVASSTNATG